jgi:hypothetical protein
MPLGSHHRPPRSRLLLLMDLVVWRRNASSPYVWDTLEVLHLEHKDEPHERDDPRAEGGCDEQPCNCMHCNGMFVYIESLPLHLRV